MSRPSNADHAADDLLRSMDVSTNTGRRQEALARAQVWATLAVVDALRDVEAAVARSADRS